MSGKHGEITTHKMTTKADRMFYLAMSTAQCTTQIFARRMSAHTYLGHKNKFILDGSEKFLYIVNKYLLNTWYGLNTVLSRGCTLKMMVIGPLHQILCRNEKIICRAESGTLFFFFFSC